MNRQGDKGRNGTELISSPMSSEGFGGDFWGTDRTTPYGVSCLSPSSPASSGRENPCLRDPAASGVRDKPAKGVGPVPLILSRRQHGILSLCLVGEPERRRATAFGLNGEDLGPVLDPTTLPSGTGSVRLVRLHSGERSFRGDRDGSRAITAAELAALSDLWRPGAWVLNDEGRALATVPREPLARRSFTLPQARDARLARLAAARGHADVSAYLNALIAADETWDEPTR